MAKPQGPLCRLLDTEFARPFLASPWLCAISASHRAKPWHQSHGDWSIRLRNKLWSVVMTTSYHEKKTFPHKTCAHSEPWIHSTDLVWTLNVFYLGRRQNPYPEVSVHNIVCQAVSCCSNQGRKILQELVSFQKAQFCNILSTREKISAELESWARSNLTKIVSRPGIAKVTNWRLILIPSETNDQPTSWARHSPSFIVALTVLQLTNVCVVMMFQYASSLT